MDIYNKIFIFSKKINGIDMTNFDVSTCRTSTVGNKLLPINMEKTVSLLKERNKREGR